MTEQSNNGVSELLRANLHEVFRERDLDARRAAIERTYAEDVRFIDAEAEVVGRDAATERVHRLVDELPVQLAEHAPRRADQVLRARLTHLLERLFRLPPDFQGDAAVMSAGDVPR